MFRTLFTIGLVTCSSLVLAGGKSSGPDYLWQPAFEFQKQTGNDESAPLLDRQHSTTAHVNQYNATISYPWHNDGVSLGLGVNLRFIEGDIRSNVDSNSLNINTALPMVYATAQFDLPYGGLKASLVGSHMDYDQWRAYDYRAKLVYSFDSGIGLQGGWKYQQLNLDAGQDVKGRFENKGPFVDFFWRF
jgi:outer membrane protein